MDTRGTKAGMARIDSSSVRPPRQQRPRSSSSDGQRRKNLDQSQSAAANPSLVAVPPPPLVGWGDGREAVSSDHIRRKLQCPLPSPPARPSVSTSAAAASGHWTGWRGPKGCLRKRSATGRMMVVQTRRLVPAGVPSADMIPATTGTRWKLLLGIAGKSGTGVASEGAASSAVCAAEWLHLLHVVDARSTAVCPFHPGDGARSIAQIPGDITQSQTTRQPSSGLANLSATRLPDAVVPSPSRHEARFTNLGEPRVVIGRRLDAICPQKVRR